MSATQAAAPGAKGGPVHAADSRYAFGRLMVSLVVMTLGGAGMYVVVVVLPSVQAEFGVDRADASLPYTLAMLGFGFGGILMGRLADRFGITVPVMLGGVGLGLGFLVAAWSDSILGFALAHGLLGGLLGSSATFAPLIADTSLWFVRRRGIAVAICASGNYLAGTLWPPITHWLVEAMGWRNAYLVIGAVCFVGMTSLALLLRPRPPVADDAAAGTATRDLAGATAGATSSAAVPGAGAGVPSPATKASQPAAMPRDPSRPFGLSPARAQGLLIVAGLACCVAMSMPQVHIVAYCGDLGFGVARGAEMLSLMLGFGIVSRLVSGMICDRIGGLRTLLLGSVLQGLALLLFLPFDSLASLYVVSALFGLFQGGIVPSYAIVMREHFPVAGIAQRTSTVLTATLLGMALGGWLSGKIFDLTGSYDAAFLNGIAWNVLNVAIVLFLMGRLRGQRRLASAKQGLPAAA